MRDGCWPKDVNQRAVALTEIEAGFDRQRINELMAVVADRQDIDAFEILYKHFVPKVRSYMLRMCKDRVVAEELAQEAMLCVWKKAVQFDPQRGQASTWIFTIARNLRIDALRRGPRPTFDPDDPSLSPEPIALADDWLNSLQEAEHLNAAMKLLKPDQIAILKMSFFEDMAHQAIADALRIPLGTVKSRIRLACEKLRAALKGMQS